MRTLPVVLLLLMTAGCVVRADTPAEETTAETAASERCADAITGSRIRQCNRGDVKVITREELERDGYTHRGTAEPGAPAKGR